MNSKNISSEQYLMNVLVLQNLATSAKCCKPTEYIIADSL